MSMGTAHNHEGAGRIVRPASGPLRGVVRVPGDKSIAHRAVIFNALGRGVARVSGIPGGEDVASSIAVMRKLGASIISDGGALRIEGASMRLAPPTEALDCGNSGTTMRLLMGALAGQRLDATLCGDESLSRRPMERVARPLREMGAIFETTDGHAPVRVRSADLEGTDHCLDVASAQVKTALLLAGLQAQGRTSVTEPDLSRDHTERMLTAMGVQLERDGLRVSISGPAVPECIDITVPGDPSSAAFLAVAASLVDGSDLTVEGICLNRTRTGFIDVLRRMGADLTVEEAAVTGGTGGEITGSLRIRATGLAGTQIGSEEIPATIDELPVLAVAAAAARGTTVISGARELRYKESDRIAAISRVLVTLGIEVEEHEDGMTIHGGTLRGGSVDAVGDHRVAMSAAVAGLRSESPVAISGAGVAAVSFPGFYELLEGLT